MTMVTKKLYLEDSGMLHSTAVVKDVGVTEDGRAWVRLDQTIFHAQGGGQKSDRGWIGNVQVSHVVHGLDGEVDHFVELYSAISRGQQVELHLDPEWRNMNARHHSGGHAIAALVEVRFPSLRAVAGHHWPGEARVEFEGDPKPAPDEIAAALDDDLAKVIANNADVRIVGAPHGDRAIQMGDYAPVACGGTHVRSLSELQGIRIDRVRVKSGKVRVSYSLSA